MAKDPNVEIAVLLKDFDKMTKVIEGMKSVEASNKAINTVLEQQGTRIKQNVEGFAKMSAVLKKMYGEDKEGLSNLTKLLKAGKDAQGVLAAISSGGVGAKLASARVSGQINQSKATDTALTTRLINSNFALAKAMEAAVANQKILGLARQNQIQPQGTLSGVRDQIKAQNIFRSQALLTGDKETAQAADAALKNLQLTETKLIEQEKQRVALAKTLLALDQKSADLTRQYSIQRGVNDPKGTTNRLNILQKQTSLALDRELIKSDGLKTTRYIQLQQRLAALTNTQQEYNQKLKDQAYIGTLKTRAGIGATDGGAAANEIAKLQGLATLKRVGADGGATLLAIQGYLSANYLILNGLSTTIRGATQYVLQLDNAFAQLQAISGTSATGMERLSKSIIDISKNTRFSAIELTEAATLLAQAGFSGKQIEQSLAAIAQGATASGSSVKEFAEVSLSALSIFNKSAAESTYVSNVLVSSLNLSKLSLDKLALGFQYAGNTAADAGVGFEEFTAVLAAMSQTGIRSGSTIGTGLRQIMISLMEPTEDFKKELKAVGLGMADVDLRTHSFIDIMEKLKEAGFGSAAAYKSMEVRGASAFVALQSQIGTVRSFEESMINSQAAVQGNADAMQSLSAKLGQLKNLLGVTAVALAGPTISGLKLFSSGMVEILNTVSKATPVLNFLGTAILALASTVAIARLRLLITSLGELLKVGEIGATIFSRFNLVALGISAALATIAYAAGKTQSGLDQMRAKVEESTAALGDNGQKIQQVDDTIVNLVNRHGELTKSQYDVRIEAQKAENAFADFNFYIEKSGLTVDGLIRKLQDLRQEIANLGLEQAKAAILDKVQLAQQLNQNAQGGQGKYGIASRLGQVVTGNPFRGSKISSEIAAAGVDPDQLKTLSDYNQSLKEQDIILDDLTKKRLALDAANREASRTGNLSTESKETLEELKSKINTLQQARLTMAQARDSYQYVVSDKLVNGSEVIRQMDTIERKLRDAGGKAKFNGFSSEERSSYYNTLASDAKTKGVGLSEKDINDIIDAQQQRLEAVAANLRAQYAPSSKEVKASARAQKDAEKMQLDADKIMESAMKNRVKIYGDQLKNTTKIEEIDSIQASARQSIVDYYAAQIETINNQLKGAKNSPALNQALQTKKSSLQERATQELADLDNDVGKKLDKLLEDRDPSKQIRQVKIELYKATEGLQKFGTDVQQTVFYPLVDGFDYINQNFGGLVKNLLSGTVSVKQGFKDMAAGIISAMLSATTNKLVGSLIGSLLGSFAGGSGGATEADFAAIDVYNSGGIVRAAAGYSVPGRDTVPALLRPGEMVLRNSAVERMGRDQLLEMNSLGNRVLSEGASNLSNSASTGGDKVVNVYVVSPDNQPQMTKNDVLVTIGQDMVKNGKTAQLVKSIAMGK